MHFFRNNRHMPKQLLGGLVLLDNIEPSLCLRCVLKYLVVG